MTKQHDIITQTIVTDPFLNSISQSSSGFSTINDGDFIPGGMSIPRMYGPMSITPEPQNEIRMSFPSINTIDLNYTPIPGLDFAGGNALGSVEYYIDAVHDFLEPYNYENIVSYSSFVRTSKKKKFILPRCTRKFSAIKG